MKELIPHERIESRIFLIRGHKVMIDRDLAILYGVDTKYVNRQVKRNLHRFPGEFMFRLTKEEKDKLVPICHRFQSLKHSSSLPYAFTEHGVIMLASVLNSEKSTKISIAIVKTFIRLREVISTHKDLFYKLSEIEKRVDKHDKLIIEIFEIIKQLTPPATPVKPKPPIGFIKYDDLKIAGVLFWYSLYVSYTVLKLSYQSVPGIKLQNPPLVKFPK